MKEPWRDDPEADQIRAAIAGARPAVQRRMRLVYRLIRLLERAGVATRDDFGDAACRMWELGCWTRYGRSSTARKERERASQPDTAPRCDLR